MTKATIARWGHSLAIPIPPDLAAALNLYEGKPIELQAEADHIVIRRAKPAYTLDQMFAGRTPEEWRALYADAYDWGLDLGNEIIEE